MIEACSDFLRCGRGDLHAEEHACLVDGDRAVPLVERRVLDGLEVTQAGIVDDYVERAERLDGLGAGGLPIGLARDVVLEERRPVAGGRGLLDGRLTGLDLDVRDEHGGALLGEPLGRLLADPARCPGDERNPTFEPVHDHSFDMRTALASPLCQSAGPAGGLWPPPQHTRSSTTAVSCSRPQQSFAGCVAGWGREGWEAAGVGERAQRHTTGVKVGRPRT